MRGERYSNTGLRFCVSRNPFAIVERKACGGLCNRQINPHAWPDIEPFCPFLCPGPGPGADAKRTKVKSLEIAHEVHLAIGKCGCLFAAYISGLPIAFCPYSQRQVQNGQFGCDKSCGPHFR